MALEVAKSRPGLRNLYDRMSPEVRGFFGQMPALVESEFPLEIILAYSFFRQEQGQHLALFCGARKLHKTDADLTWTALNNQHITREAYLGFFHSIYGFPIDSETVNCLERAEKTRDRLMHGKDVDEGGMREAISRVLHYAERVNDLIDNQHNVGFKPFTGDLRGFTGRLEPLDKSTSRWILKGMGFTLS